MEMRCNRNNAKHYTNEGKASDSLSMRGCLSQKVRLILSASTLQMLLMLVALQLPAIGHCESGNGWFKGLFESKDKNMNTVAAKQVAEFSADWSVSVSGLDFSPDGKYLASTQGWDPVNVWDWQSGRIVHKLEKARGANIVDATETIRYSPNGRLLATCHSRASGNVVVRIWRTDTWEIAHDLTDPVGGGACNAIGFTPDGKSLVRVLNRIFTKPGDNLIVYSTDAWEPIWGMRTVPFQPNTLAISPDGKRISVGGELDDNSPGTIEEVMQRKAQPQIRVMDLTSHNIVHTIQNMWANRLDWSPDSANIAVAGARYGPASPDLDVIRIYDAQSGELVAHDLFGLPYPAIRYTPDGKYIIESNAEEIRIWDGQHRKLLQEIPYDVKNFANALTVSRDGRYFAAGKNSKILVWEMK